MKQKSFLEHICWDTLSNCFLRSSIRKEAVISLVFTRKGGFKNIFFQTVLIPICAASLISIGCSNVFNDALGNNTESSAHALLVVSYNGTTITPVTGSIACRSVMKGEKSDNTITISNTGNRTVSIKSIQVADTDHFSLTGVPESIAAGSETSISLSFTSSEEGEFATSLSIESDDPVNGKYTMAVTGKATTVPEPSIIIKDGSSQVPNSDGTVSLANTTVKTQTTKQITIYNNGNADLVISSVTAAGDSSITVSHSLDTIVSGAADTFTIIFSPQSDGQKTAAITVNCNDPEYPHLGLTASGVGISAPSLITVKNGTTVLQSGSGSYYYGFAYLGASVSADYTITNNEEQSCSITSISLDNTTDFTLTKSYTGTLGKGESATIRVTFNPVTGSDVSTTLRISSNDPNTPEYAITLRGNSNSQYSVYGTFPNFISGLAVDSGNNIYATGYAGCVNGTAEASRICFVAKIDAYGVEKWKITPINDTSKKSSFSGIAVDSHNDVFISGGNGTKGVLYKINASDGLTYGTPWPVYCDRSASNWEGFHTALCIDANDNLYSGHYYYNGAYTRGKISSYSGSAALNWSVEYDSSTSGIRGIALSKNAGLLGVVHIENYISSTSDKVVRFFNLDGTETLAGWPEIDTGRGELDQAFSLAFSPAGDILYTNGYHYKNDTSSEINKRWEIRKYNVNGGENTSGWPKQFDLLTGAAESPSFSPQTIVVSTTGDIYASCIYGSPLRGTIKKLRSDGTEYGGNWPIVIPPYKSTDTNFDAMILDKDGNLIVSMRYGSKWSLLKFNADGVPKGLTKWQ
ncbi:MAG TPA: choice-of-anchor D domain-containing protein [Spirochaetota bacterium]|nr:choice-of-anchor D domain-containing protein [Spirochaetota bacterium]